MKPINQATIIFLSIGAFSGLLILVDYLESSHFVSKEKAIEVFSNAVNCIDEPAKLSDISIELLHVKNQTVFFVDERNMQDMALLIGGYTRADHFKDGTYLWKVTGFCYSKQGAVGATHFIDATDGKLLE